MKRAIVIILSLIPMFSSGQDIRLVDFGTSACDKELDPYRLRTRIINQQFNDDTLFISIGTVGNCGAEFFPIVKFSQDTLELNLEENGSAEDCLCCYEFYYRILGIEDLNVPMKFQSKLIQKSNEKYKTYPIRYFIFEGDTTGYIDKYGLRQGIHISKHKGMLIERHIKDDEYIKFRLTDKKGNIIRESKDLFEVYESIKE